MMAEGLADVNSQKKEVCPWKTAADTRHTASVPDSGTQRDFLRDCHNAATGKQGGMGWVLNRWYSDVEPEEHLYKLEMQKTRYTEKRGILSGKSKAWSSLPHKDRGLNDD